MPTSLSDVSIKKPPVHRLKIDEHSGNMITTKAYLNAVKWQMQMTLLQTRPTKKPTPQTVHALKLSLSFYTTPAIQMAGTSIVSQEFFNVLLSVWKPFLDRVNLLFAN
jgi:hypothetical protein